MKKIYIPNSQFFSAIPTGTDTFMSIFGLKSKIHEIDNMPHPRITRANKYLKRMYKRLDVYARKTNVRGFTVVSLILLKRSVAFRLAAINFKWPKWYGKGTGSQAKKIRHIVKDLAERQATDIEYKRVWIPKGSNPYGRPLGCPTVPWRIYLWMFYFLIDIWTANNHGRAPWQHGGFSRKGPNTFFDQLIGDLRYKKAWIYEFDLKGYFNNITHESILKALEVTKIPEILKHHASEILKARPTEYGEMPREVYAKAREQYGYGDGPASNERFVFQNRFDLLENEKMSDVELYNAINHPSERRIKSITIECEMSDGSIQEFIIPQVENSWEGPAHDWIHGLRMNGVGTPQGASSSPLLTSLASSYHCGIHNENLMMYMDDGIITADTEEELNLAKTVFAEAAKTMGVEIAPEKSGLVKQSGVWLKDLKIIGFRIDRFMDWVFSSTRSGTEIPMPLPNYEQLRSYYTNHGVTSFTDEDRKELIAALQKLETIPEGSRARFIEWIERTFGRSISILRSELEQKDFNPFNYGTHELMVKEGKSGKVMAHIWNPSEEDVREKITEGVKLAIKAIQNNPKSFVMDKLGPYRIDTIAIQGPKALQSLSTEMSVEFLKWEARIKPRPKSTIKGNTGTMYTLAGIRKPRRK